MDPGRRLDIEGTPYKARFSEADRERLRASESAPSLFDRVERWLERTPFLRFGDFDFWAAYRAAVDTMLAQERRFVEDNPTLPPQKKQRELQSVEQTAQQFEALFDRERYAALRDDGAFRLSHRAFQAALLINLYRDEPILQLPFRMLAALMDVDENLTKWRYRHALMVLRMIGTKVGTGGSSGHEYLRRTAEQHKIFGDLFKISTFLIPRSALPELPAQVRRAMDFRLGAMEE
jgi:tryptophan 2,3-dioxygenase